MKQVQERLGRSWMFSLGILTLATTLGAVIIIQDERQYAFVVQWWADLAKWLVLGTTGLKVGQKGLLAFAGGKGGKK